MNQQRYQILFKGEILSGFDPAQARRDTARLLKAGPVQLAQLFSGQYVGIRKNLPASDAARYRAALSGVGLRVHVVEMPLALSGQLGASAGFHITYAGEMLPGLSREQVMERVAQKLKLDEARMARLFSGKKAVLKKGLDADAAARYLTEAAQLGMLARIEVELAATAAESPSRTRMTNANTVESPPMTSSSTEEAKRFMASAAKTQLYLPRAPLFGEHKSQPKFETSTVIDIDIARTFGEESPLENIQTKFDTTEEPMPQAKIWQAPALSRDEESMSAEAFLPAQTDTPHQLSSHAHGVKPAIHAIELHSAPPASSRTRLRTHAMQRLVAMSALLPRALARMLY